MGIKENLSYWMEKRGENPNSLSVKSRVPQPTIWRILEGVSQDPRRTTVEQLARTLGVKADAMYGPLPDSAEAAAEMQLSPTQTGIALNPEQILGLIRSVLQPLGVRYEDVILNEDKVLERLAKRHVREQVEDEGELSGWENPGDSGTKKQDRRKSR